ncbi:transmembrane protein 161B-like isoform X2 [Oscarella lobularis]|uniref:transmembrane protein 161B-like isoform X2 n=1 Tax=Oscarella lobularis TaxID=121494 RepID=UPI0033133F15
MAVLGIQLVFTMIVATIFHKIFPYYSPARLLVTGLRRYAHPSLEELMRYKPSKKSGNKKRGQETSLSSLFDFSLPKDNDIELAEKEIKDSDLNAVHFCNDYERLMNLFFCSLGVHLLTQAYYFGWSKADREGANLTAIWLLCVMLYSIYVVFVLNTALFMGAEGTGERSLMIVCGSFFFVATMGFILLDDKFLDLGLNDAYGNISKKTGDFLQSHGINVAPLGGLLVTWKVSVGFSCAILAAFLTFPGFRYAKMHLDALADYQHSAIMILLIHLNFFLPLFASLMWIYHLTKEPLISGEILTDSSYGVVRLGTVIVLCLFRLFMFRLYLQSYLKMANRQFQSLKREPGRISVLALQHKIRSVFQYLFAGGLQYIAPVVLLFCWALLAYITGGYSFCNLTTSTQSARLGPTYAWGADADDEATQAVGMVASAVATVLNTPIFWEKIFLFACWWLVTALFLVSSFAVVYYRYIAD